MIKNVKSTKMTHQDNKWGFLCDQHLSSEFLFVSAVFGNLSEIPPSKNDCTEFAVSHKSFNFLFFSPLNIDIFFILHLWQSKEENEEISQ